VRQRAGHGRDRFDAMIAPLPPLLLRGDCLVELARIPDGSVDSVVCDPPYGLEFMGKAWDKYTPLDFELWCAKWAAECYRILKPGGHLLAFGGSRT
ncbi:DNA methyltransferase, partial [Enterococcus faecium]|uniref:DNA methyltransferase n=1 Tax=Enterococcus faecium TaxID=1352 RepID=UPI0034E954F9